MLKYYFGYKSLFGAPFPVRWVEDNGVAVGGEVNCIQGNKHPLTYKEFTYGDFNGLKDKYPYKEPKED